MSQENVELVREVYRGWARGDFSVGALSDDFEWHQLAGAVEPGSRTGAEVGTALGRIFEVYEDFRVEAEEYVDAGANVIVVGRARGRARRSGMDLDQRFAFVWSAHDGMLVRLAMYPNRADALKAAGLAQ